VASKKKWVQRKMMSNDAKDVERVFKRRRRVKRVERRGWKRE
jgi:hypothetical protein